MHHLLLLQEHSLTWISRSAFGGDRDVWSEQSAVNSAEGFDPLPAAADIFKHAPRGRLKMADKLTVLLGYPYVRHMVLPWRAALTKTSEWEGYASAKFYEQYGGDNSSRKIVVDTAGFGQPRLAAATDAVLVEGLLALAAQHKLRLASCMSLLTAAARSHWDMLEDNCVLSLPQQDSMECLFRKQGMWQGVGGMPTLPDTALADNVAVAALLAKADGFVASESLVLAVTPFPGNLLQTPEHAPNIRWLDAAHPWLADGDSRRRTAGLTASAADVETIRIEPVGAHAAASAVSVKRADEDGVASSLKAFDRANFSWGLVAQHKLPRQSGHYGEWRLRAWHTPMACSVRQTIYFWLDAPPSWPREELQ
ncbi:hypothetical protein [Collimonas silvisoli]|uniref:hypothetical protein n=1 Tax=Collimonas silvisoli TaxID=2825884 RepID=UPI001B8D7C9A|nr:hypothetical protein [Collimonas silvisoli]